MVYAVSSETEKVIWICTHLKIMNRLPCLTYLMLYLFNILGIIAMIAIILTKIFLFLLGNSYLLFLSILIYLF